MTTVISLDLIAELSKADRDEIRDLALAVYPPDDIKDWAGRDKEWAELEWCVRIWEAEGELASYAGILVKEGSHDKQPVLLGGVGHVMTHPAARRRGYAEKGVRRAVDFLLKDTSADFALLVCGEWLVPYYARLGWQDFAGQLLVRQHGERIEFTFNRVMTLGIASKAPLSGIIDLRGPPW